MPGLLSIQCAAKPSHQMDWLMKCGKASVFLALVATANLSFGSKLQPIADIAIVAAHGLTVERAYCPVSFNGQMRAIQEIRKGHSDYLGQDWAVIRLEDRIERASPRLKWHVPKFPELTEFVKRDGKVLVMRHANGNPTGSI